MLLTFGKTNRPINKLCPLEITATTKENEQRANKSVDVPETSKRPILHCSTIPMSHCNSNPLSHINLSLFVKNLASL